MAATPRFQSALLKVPGQPFQGRCFRVVSLESYLKAATPTLLFDLGPKISKSGQRFSPPGDHRGLYVSTELLTAGCEFADGRKAWTGGDCVNHVAFHIDVKLASVLDLTDAAVRRKLKTSQAEVQSAWLGFAALNGGVWPATWDLGHETFASGRFDGLRFPSTKNQAGDCLLIFTERLTPGKTSVIIQREDGTEWERLP